MWRAEEDQERNILLSPGLWPRTCLVERLTSRIFIFHEGVSGSFRFPSVPKMQSDWHCCCWSLNPYSISLYLVLPKEAAQSLNPPLRFKSRVIGELCASSEWFLHIFFHFLQLPGEQTRCRLICVKIPPEDRNPREIRGKSLGVV